MVTHTDLHRYETEIAKATKRIGTYRRNMQDDPSIKHLQDRILKSLEDELVQLKRLRVSFGLQNFGAD